jgi:uncharacterized protein
MPLEDFIKEVIAATPNRRIEGKKRLQKLIYLLESAGFDTEASFFLKDYGPFSREVENAADMMSIFGELVERNVLTGYSNYIATAYELPENLEVHPDDRLAGLVRHLEKYRSVELEIASTIKYFENEGQSLYQAIESTKAIKPSKSTDRVISAANEVLGFIKKQHAAPSNP